MSAKDSTWQCPKCGRKFAHPNQWHSCGLFSLDDHLRSADPNIAALYRRFERMARECGPIVLSPSKSVIAIKARTTFAGVKLQKDGLRVGLLLARRVESPRFVKVATLSPGSHEHVFRVASPTDLDDEVRGWLREAYEVGSRR